MPFREVQYPRELRALPLQILPDRLDGQRGAGGGLPGGVADHPGAAADHADRPVPGLLGMAEQDHREQVAGGQAVRGGIVAAVEGERSRQGANQPLLVRDLLDEAAFAHGLQEICGVHRLQYIRCPASRMGSSALSVDR